MKSGEVAKLLGISTATIRRYADDFEKFLSRTDGRIRDYSSEDYRVLATIKKLYNDGFPKDHINSKLEEGYRIEVSNIDEIGFADNRMVPAVVVEQVIDSSNVRAELEATKRERDRLLDMLTDKDERIREIEKDRDNRLDQKDERIRELEQEIRQLNRQLGRLEGRLDLNETDES